MGGLGLCDDARGAPELDMVYRDYRCLLFQGPKWKVFRGAQSISKRPQLLVGGEFIMLANSMLQWGWMGSTGSDTLRGNWTVDWINPESVHLGILNSDEGLPKWPFCSSLWDSNIIITFLETVDWLSLVNHWWLLGSHARKAVDTVSEPTHVCFYWAVAAP